MHYLGHGADPLIANDVGAFPLQAIQDPVQRNGWANSFDEKKSEMINAMLKNLPPESASPAPAEQFNAVSTKEDIEVSGPIELKKKPAPDTPQQQPHGAKGFTL